MEEAEDEAEDMGPAETRADTKVAGVMVGSAGVKTAGFLAVVVLVAAAPAADVAVEKAAHRSRSARKTRCRSGHMNRDCTKKGTSDRAPMPQLARPAVQTAVDAASVPAWGVGIRHTDMGRWLTERNTRREPAHKATRLANTAVTAGLCPPDRGAHACI